MEKWVWKDHWDWKGKHAYLSPSSHSWTKYDPEKLKMWIINDAAKKRGTELHELAEKHIRLGVPMSRTKNTLNMYINDAIGFNLSPEVPIGYSDNAFGTADAIGYSYDRKLKTNFLRIHDLKTGVTPASMLQLKLYAAYFCLDYDIDIFGIETELRLYQSNEIIIENSLNEPGLKDEIKDLMDLTVYDDKLVQEILENL